ncbi:MAG TPA: gamma carbonic anhydrase family protein [Deltaproteobacteria bacterium]|nr:gamma carbonic anhydrase family protein [Deltaproteobacteria bacterium]
MNIYGYRNKFPQIDPSVFLAPLSVVIGDVVIGEESSIWYHTIVRGDVNYIRIGEGTNVQDASILHVTREKFPLEIGNLVTIGHHAKVHGCVVEDRCLIGIGATILDGAKIGEGSLVAAGSLVTPGTQIPPGSLVMGAPAKVKKKLSPEEQERIVNTSKHYIELAAEYREAFA